jgi:hypothetical protein
MIQHVLHNNIDKIKWDTCLKNAANSLIYGYSFYLDAIAGNWDAIVINDYEAVMPLVWRKKFFISYLYQPPFTQQAGIFYRHPLTNNQYKEIENTLQQQHKFAEIFMNFGNSNCFNPQYCKPQTNLVLDINKPYEIIYNRYLPGFTKSLRRIAKFNFKYTEATDIDEVILLYKKLYRSRVTHLTEKDFTAFNNLCWVLQQQQMLVIKKVLNENNNLMGLALLFKDERRLYNIISCITDEGKRMEANYFLYDSIIKEYSNKGLVLDLEGSEIKGVADFYNKMNPVNQPYNFYRFNNLPALLRLFKK